jgi:hypothetical protein
MARRRDVVDAATGLPDRRATGRVCGEAGRCEAPGTAAIPDGGIVWECVNYDHRSGQGDRVNNQSRHAKSRRREKGPPRFEDEYRLAVRMADRGQKRRQCECVHAVLAVLGRAGALALNF